MEIMHARCAGLDVHKKTVVCCVWTLGDKPKSRARKQTRTFGTMTCDLLALADWLRENQVTHAAMEATGVYWWPIYNVLEAHGLELLVVNALHVKAVPGRKTDVADAEWLGDLLRHGLLRGGFVPPKGQRELRELSRHRSALIAKKAAAVQELHHALESTNIKLSTVVSDLTGASASLILTQLLMGNTDPVKLSELAKGRLRNKLPQLQAALQGVVAAHHQIILSQLLAEIELFDEQIASVCETIGERLHPQHELIERLDQIPGVNARVAEVILAEVGSDMSRFPSEGQLISWAGLCPGNHQSAGKKKSCRIRKGNRELKGVLMEAAHGAARTKQTYFESLFRRLAAKRGKRRALVALARTILATAYHMIKRGTTYRDLGVNYFDQRQPERIVQRLSNRLSKLGYTVTLTPVAQAA